MFVLVKVVVRERVLVASVFVYCDGCGVYVMVFIECCVFIIFSFLYFLLLFMIVYDVDDVLLRIGCWFWSVVYVLVECLFVCDGVDVCD